ncbi:MAG: di-/tricarboxylate transporter [bacterium]|nr:MAG: di-/tricarboxylate transporter [bacterium]KAF0148495.1 MAG: di-/tricarboxylate transporter [bacterium]KAF0168039.1 MAG: di-/tricarboxylate transporter [bacterium]TXT21216.1 MAG: di-/tricarboxylate transporter [bacterium]
MVALCIGLLATNRFPADVVMVGGLTLLLLAGVLTPVAALSAFLNNTPVVAMFIPAVQDWARRHNLAVSHLMLPLSYAAIAGGTCTLIGTSTNLVVNGLLLKETELSGLGFFDIAWVGIPTLILTIAFTVLFGRRLLPERQSVMSRMADAREYTVEMLVEADSPLDGKSIRAGRFRTLYQAAIIAVAAASRLDVSVMPFAIVIMKAASASFATPLGYQTNLMVMGPGGYTFSDYFRLGIPLTVLTGVLTVLIAPLVWPF